MFCYRNISKPRISTITLILTPFEANFAYTDLLSPSFYLFSLLFVLKKPIHSIVCWSVFSYTQTLNHSAESHNAPAHDRFRSTPRRY